MRRIFVNTRAETARELSPKPSAKAQYSPTCSECKEPECWAIFPTNWPTLRNDERLKYLTSKNMRTSKGEKRLEIASTYCLELLFLQERRGVSSLGRYVDAKRRHPAAGLQKRRQNFDIIKAVTMISTQIPEPITQFVENVSDIGIIWLPLHLSTINRPIR